MKKFSQLNEAKQKVEVQEDTINYISAAQLQKYLEITGNKFISQEAINVINWLIDNNATYIKQLGNGGSNALEDFYNGPIPKDPALKELYKNIGVVIKKYSILQIPVFQTKEQFSAIIKKQVSPDEVLIDLQTEKGKQDVAKKYTPLVHKIARSYIGRSNLEYDELYSVGLEGLTWAINGFGKKSNKQLKREELTGEKEDISKFKNYSFLSFASYMIRVAILEAIKNESQTVRIATSVQQKERNEKGYNTKNNSVSGDKIVGDSDDNGKTMFDYMNGAEDASKNLDREDIEKLWEEIYAELEKKFGEKTMDIWYSFNELRGRKKIKGKDLAKKYGYNSPSAITAELTKVNSYIQKNKKILNKLADVYELMKECQNEIDRETPVDESIYVVNTYNEEN